MNDNTTCTNAKVESKTLCVCPNTSVHPSVIHRGKIVVKIPVVLSECFIQIDTEACIELEHPALEIKRIKKDVILTQAKLIPFASNYNKYCQRFEGGKLFLKGYIRKNIEYATVECTNRTDGSCCCEGGKVVAGDIKHTTAYVKFHCVTDIDYICGVKPVVKYREPTKQIEIFRNCQYNCFGKCTPEYIGSDFCQYNSQETIGYTEGFDIELEDIDITEIDLEKHYCVREATEEAGLSYYPGTFNKLVEKLALNIKLKVLQEQQVKIYSHGSWLPKATEEENETEEENKTEDI
ncbi:CsxC family protein [Oceanirhabdus seepicola]|uniref:DUF7852 domain-containing protein n=1 Tax=Oceanirhabdus seepicola TaxID=2828781 RepID=A0A9J6P9P6_9CLOT|nr:hypothetical protein [Oceanirhabdus seepicola]MCM1992165.1 hypothetical protein [Oceanirhabdus seepicola]